MRFSLDLGRCLGQRQGLLGVEDLLDPGTQQRPIGLGEREVAAEIEQGTLPNAGADALGGDEAMGEIRGSPLVVARVWVRRTNIAEKRVGELGAAVNAAPHDYGTTLDDSSDLRPGNAVNKQQSPQNSPDSERMPLHLINLG